jgi:hypothetical protein
VLLVFHDDAHVAETKRGKPPLDEQLVHKKQAGVRVSQPATDGSNRQPAVLTATRL